LGSQTGKQASRQTCRQLDNKKQANRQANRQANIETINMTEATYWIGMAGQLGSTVLQLHAQLVASSCIMDQLSKSPPNGFAVAKHNP